MRWSFEETSRLAKGEPGLTTTRSARMEPAITLSLLAHPFLTAVAAKKRGAGTAAERLVAPHEYPLTWSTYHVDEFKADPRSSKKGLALLTLSANSGGIRAFCSDG